MGSRRSIILGRLTHNSIGVTNKEQIQCVFFIFSSMHRQVFEDELLVVIFLYFNLRQVEQTFTCVIFIEEIITRIVVNLQIAHVHTVLVRRRLLDPAEYVAQRSWDNSSICVALRPSGYREGFS